MRIQKHRVEEIFNRTKQIQGPLYQPVSLAIRKLPKRKKLTVMFKAGRGKGAMSDYDGKP